MSEPLVSIIMPAYNVENYIVEAIESILNQTYINFELLICDDGSTDQTWQKINQFDDKRIVKFSNKVNIGNLKTTNFLFTQCIGQFISIQDADDFSCKDRLKKCVEYLNQNHEIGILGTNYMIVDENNNEILCGLLPLSNSKILERMEKEVAPLLFASIMIRKNIVDDVGYFKDFFDRKGYADLEWLSRCVQKTKVNNLDEILYFYRKHSSSFTSSNFNNNLIFLDENITYLIIFSHITRIKNGIDIFENTINIKKILADRYFRLAENKYWEKDYKKFKFNISKSIYLNPYNFKNYRLVLYVFRNFLISKYKCNLI